MYSHEERSRRQYDIWIKILLYPVKSLSMHSFFFSFRILSLPPPPPPPPSQSIPVSFKFVFSSINHPLINRAPSPNHLFPSSSIPCPKFLYSHIGCIFFMSFHALHLFSGITKCMLGAPGGLCPSNSLWVCGKLSIVSEQSALSVNVDEGRKSNICAII